MQINLQFNVYHTTSNLKLEVVGVNAYTYENLESYVLAECRNFYNLSHRGIKNDDLRVFCHKKGVKVKSRDTRDVMFDRLFESGVTALELYEEFKSDIGAHYVDYAERFGVTKNEYNKLKRRNFFVIDGHYEAKAYGGWITVPVLSAEQFFSVTREDIDAALNSKIKRSCSNCYC